jgi:protein SCO1/2
VILRVRKLVLTLLALAVFGAAVYLGDRFLTSDAERTGRQDRASAVGGPFALTDATGAIRRSEEFRGRYMLVFFGYTHCPDICPATIQNVSDALARLPRGAERIQPVFIAVDPARDTPARLARYAKAFDGRVLLLTGDIADIREVAKAYKAYFTHGSKDKDGNYPVSHTSTLFLIGPDGRYVDHYSSDIAVDKLARALARYVAPGG